MNTQKKVTQQEIEVLLRFLKKAIQGNLAFVVMAEGRGNAMTAGSGKKELIPFLVGCMMSNPETADLIMNTALNFIREKMSEEVCGDCEKKGECRRIKEMCDTPDLMKKMKQGIVDLENMIKSSMN